MIYFFYALLAVELAVLAGALVSLHRMRRRLAAPPKVEPVCFIASFFYRAVSLELRPEKYDEKLAFISCCMRIAARAEDARA